MMNNWCQLKELEELCVCVCVLVTPGTQMYKEESGERELLRLLAEVYFISAEVGQTLRTRECTFMHSVMFMFYTINEICL